MLLHCNIIEGKQFMQKEDVAREYKSLLYNSLLRSKWIANNLSRQEKNSDTDIMGKNSCK